MSGLTKIGKGIGSWFSNLTKKTPLTAEEAAVKMNKQNTKRDIKVAQAANPNYQSPASRLAGGIGSTAKSAVVVGGLGASGYAIIDALTKAAAATPDPEPIIDPEPVDPIVDPVPYDPALEEGGDGSIFDWLTGLFGGGTEYIGGEGEEIEPAQASSWTSYLPYIIAAGVGLVLLFVFVKKPKTKGKKKK